MNGTRGREGYKDTLGDLGGRGRRDRVWPDFGHWMPLYMCVCAVPAIVAGRWPEKNGSCTGEDKPIDAEKIHLYLYLISSF